MARVALRGLQIPPGPHCFRLSPRNQLALPEKLLSGLPKEHQAQEEPGKLPALGRLEALVHGAALAYSGLFHLFHHGP